MRNSDVFVSGVPVAIEGATINQDTQRTSTVHPYSIYYVSFDRPLELAHKQLDFEPNQSG